MIDALIVDDEPLARTRLRELLREERDIRIVGECANGPEAVLFLREHLPDALFLDIQMPEMDGFEVLQTIGVGRVPAVVFVTAHDAHALRAFEVHALDYLLKPFDRARFARALARLRSVLAAEDREAGERSIRALLKEGDAAPRYLRRVVVRAGDKVLFVPTESIDWIESDDNYARLHVGAKSYAVRETLRALVAKLDPDRFMRIHRSTAVNIERMVSVESWFHGAHRVTLHDGTHLTTSRSYESALRQLLRNTTG